MVLLDPILNPLLSLEPVWAIAIIAFALSLFSVIATKLITDQDKMKAHRAELKTMQKKLKSARSDPKKAMKMQQEMMEVNMVVMKESFKPMLLTIIPFLLVFAWLNASFSYVPIFDNTDFSVTAKVEGASFVELTILPEEKVLINSTNQSVVDGVATFSLNGEAGEYTMQFTANGETVEQDLIIGTTYASPEKKHNSEVFQSTRIENESVEVHFFNWDIGWFWAYIIFSIVFSIALRKGLKVY